MEENTGIEPEIKDPKAVLSALERAKNEAKRFREEKEALENNVSSLTQQNSAMSGKLLREKTRSAINDLGIKDADRLIKYVDFNQLDFDDNFDVIGLSDQIDNIRKDLPELFDPKLRVAGQADSADVKPAQTGTKASEIQAKYLLGKK